MFDHEYINPIVEIPPQQAFYSEKKSVPIEESNKLYGWLKSMRVLMANNLPYQAFIDRGYFAVKESVFEVNGLKKTYQQTFVTGKGQHFVINLLKKYYGKEVLQ